MKKLFIAALTIGLVWSFAATARADCAYTAMQIDAARIGIGQMNVYAAEGNLQLASMYSDATKHFIDTALMDQSCGAASADVDWTYATWIMDAHADRLITDESALDQMNGVLGIIKSQDARKIGISGKDFAKWQAFADSLSTQSTSESH